MFSVCSWVRPFIDEGQVGSGQQGIDNCDCQGVCVCVATRLTDRKRSLRISQHPADDDDAM